MAQAQVQPVSQGSSGLSFTQGFVLGQLSIALIIFLLIKFFIFGEPPSADDRALHLSSLRRARTLAHQQSYHSLRARSNSTTNRKNSVSHVVRPAAGSGHAPSISQILAKTYYNVKGHQPESLDWFNVLIAQTIAQLRDDARQDGAVLTSLTSILNSGSKPDWIGEIRVTEIALGDEFPIFSNCRVMPAEDGGFASVGESSGVDTEARLQARMDVDLSDVITLGIETTLVLNYPKPRVAVLPVALAVSVVRFSGTLAVSFIPSSSPPSASTDPTAGTAGTAGPTQQQPHTANTPLPTPNSNPTQFTLTPQGHIKPSPTTPTSFSTSTSSPQNPNPTHRPTTLAFAFLDDYRLDLSVRSLVGSRSRLQDVPKIAQLIESRLHAWFDERAVEPRFQQIPIPSLWPRKRNTRGGSEEEEVMEKKEDGWEDEVVLESVEMDAEKRLEAEGAKLREAEVKAGERTRNQNRGVGSGGGGGGMNEGMRWRAEQLRQSHRDSGKWSGQRGMPGAMPGG